VLVLQGKQVQPDCKKMKNYGKSTKIGEWLSYL